MKKNVSAARRVNKAEAKLQALKAAGVNVDNLFAMTSVSGNGIVARLNDGKLEVLSNEDPIFASIAGGGTVPDRRLFRRWVMAQTFHMLATGDWTKALHAKGYEYSWKMMLDELLVQSKLSYKDSENYEARHRWFNRSVAVAMCEDYIKKLHTYIDGLKTRKCKGEAYKRIRSNDYFVCDLDTRIYRPLERALKQVRKDHSLWTAMNNFNKKRIPLHSDVPACPEWIDAYKGCGAYHTLQNLIRFHGVKIHTPEGCGMDALEAVAAKWQNGNGWRMLGLLKQELLLNHIDIKREIAGWRK